MQSKMKPSEKKAPFPTFIIAPIIIVVLILSYMIMTLFSSPTVVASQNQIELPQTNPTAIAWPAYGQAAVGGVGYGVLSTNGAQVSHPIASIAKLILAMSVLDKYPLGTGQTGPSITITQDDANFYKAALAQGGSLVPVNVGEQLSEYQMLQALLIASGDNIADTLAVWAYGSMDDYTSYANQMVSDLGLKETSISDASGLSPQTVSSASNLVLLGEKAIGNPVIADIVSQPKVTLPVAGSISNYDSQLGQNGVIGIKTGNTPEAGGCFLFAVINTVDQTQPIVVGAILGAKNLATVLNDSKTFIQANINNFKLIPVVKAGQVVANYFAPWGQKVEAVAQQDITLFTLSGKKISITFVLKPLQTEAQNGSSAGTFSASDGTNTASIAVALRSALTPPTFGWKLLHPFVK